MRDAPPQARSIAAIEGFYDAAIDVSIDRDVSPIVVRVKVEPGPRTTVGTVAIDVTGPATLATSPDTGAAAVVRERFPLRPGDAFRQADWIGAKDAAVRDMRRSPYAAARLAASEARVDPGAARADLAWSPSANVKVPVPTAVRVTSAGSNGMASNDGPRVSNSVPV